MSLHTSTHLKNDCDIKGIMRMIEYINNLLAANCCETFKTMVEIQTAYLFHAFFLSAAVVAVTEVLNYFMIYSKADYQTQVVEGTRVTKKLAETKQELKTDPNNKKALKNVESLEADLTKVNTALQSYKLKSGLIGAVLMIGMFQGVGSKFEGIAVARLPFTPISLFASILNRGIEDDVTALSLIGCYILMNNVLKNVVSLFVKVGVPEFGAQGFMAQMEAAQKKNQ